MKHFLKNNICLITAVLCCLGLEGYGLVLDAHGYAVPQEGIGSHVALAVLNMREGIFPWNMDSENERMMMTEMAEAVPEPEILPEPEAVPQDEVVAESETMPAEVPEEEIAETLPEETVAESTAELPAEEIGPSFATVTDDYFADAVFIGDSRMVGVCEYAGIPNSTFYAKTSMTIYKMLGSRVETTREVRTVRDGLQKNRFGKVYLMVGLNELGVGNTEYFINQYRDVVQEIRGLQPDALIYIQGIMHVSGRLDRKGGVFNNDTINRRNAALAALAEEMNAVYLDVNEAYDDANGNLPQSYTADDIHLKANYYDLWHEFYLTHAVTVIEDGTNAPESTDNLESIETLNTLNTLDVSEATE